MTNDPLHQLIKSLNGTEKRYFKLYANKQDGEKDYIELFDFIDKTKNYSESALKEAFKKRDFIAHLSVIKNYLFNTIIDSLHEYSSYTTVEHKLEDLLKKITVLYHKGLIDLSIKYIEKAKKIAQANECFAELIKILEIQRLIAFKSSSQQYKKLNEITDELLATVEKFHNLHHYINLDTKISQLFYGLNGQMDYIKIQELINHPLYTNEKLAFSNRALVMLLGTKATYYSIIEQNDAKAAHYVHLILQNHENNPVLKENPLKYAETIHRYLTIAAGAGKYDLHNQYLTILKKLSETKIAAKDKGFIIGSYYLNLFYSNAFFGLFSENKEIYKTIKNEVIHNALVPLVLRIGIQYFLCVTLIGLHHFKDALKLITQELLCNENIFSILRRSSRLLLLIVHYELGNTEQLVNEIEAAQRLQHNTTYTPIELQLFKFFKQLSNAYNSKEILQHFESFKATLQQLSYQPDTDPITKYFDFRTWIESKLKRTTFAALVKENAKSMLSSPKT